MMWGCFSSHGTGRLHVIEGMMNGALWQKILEMNPIPPAHRDDDEDETWVELHIRVMIQNRQQRVNWFQRSC